MGTTIKEKFGTSNQAITLGLASLANLAARQSTAIDNSSNLFQDALVQLKIKTGASGTSPTGTLEVWAAGSADGGTTFSDGATGVDSAFTPTAAPNAQKIGTINVAADATIYKSHPFSVAAGFNGILPEKWAIFVINKAGSALDGTAGNFSAFYEGVYSQGV